MSKLYKCDRCKKYFADEVDEETFCTPSKVLFGDIETEKEYLYQVELCPKCAEVHAKWLYGEESNK